MPRVFAASPLRQASRLRSQLLELRRALLWLLFALLLRLLQTRISQRKRRHAALKPIGQSSALRQCSVEIHLRNFTKRRLRIKPRHVKPEDVVALVPARRALSLWRFSKA
jgi:hypothetical protein